MGQIIIAHEDAERIGLAIGGLRRGAETRDRDNVERLQRELQRAARVDRASLSPDIVALGSRVTVLDLDSGTRERYTVVLPAEADIARLRISVLAPIGAALIGYGVGDEIEWPVPGGVRHLRIVAADPGDT